MYEVLGVVVARRDAQHVREVVGVVVEQPGDSFLVVGFGFAREAVSSGDVVSLSFEQIPDRPAGPPRPGHGTGSFHSKPLLVATTT